MPGVKATVVVPLWNHRSFVERQLDSLLKQWRPDLELLVIDDGSTDDGFAVAQAYLSSYPGVRATLMRNERTLGAGLPNVALQYVSSDIIIEADSDDIALPTRLDSILRCFDDDPTCHLVTSNALKIGADDTPLGLYDTMHADETFSDAAVAARRDYDTRWLGATAAFRRSVIEAFAPIDDELCAPHLDLLLPFRALLLGSHRYLCQPLVGWRQHSTNAHRLTGSLDAEGPRAERFKFSEVTVLAQRLRDITFLQRARPSTSSFNAALPVASAVFFEKFSAWTRFRLRLERSEATCAAPKPSFYVNAVPPIVTLSPGVPMNFSAHETGGQVAARSSGFHQPDKEQTWTHRHGLLSVRLANPATDAIVLRLSRLPFLDTQRVRILLLGGAWIDAELRSGVTEVEVALPAEGDRTRPLTLVISTPDAKVPAEFIPGSDDKRLLGVGLVSIEARRP